MLLLAGLPGAHAADTPGDGPGPVAAGDESPSTAPAVASATSRSSEERGSKAEAASEDEKEGSPIQAHYDTGLHISSADGNYATTIKWRVQMRMTDVSSPDLVGEEDGIEEETGFLIRRARFKMNGHAYRPWLKYKMEYGIEGGVLLTWSMDMARREDVQLRVGQYKVLYNRERVDSSGKLTFVDRSIVNSPFTVDRQEGLTVMGRLFKGTRGDSRYAFGVFTGTGRGGPLEGDRRPMYAGRWQWNFLKRDLPFSEGDLKRRTKAAGSFALAASSNRSAFTRFSSAGGGELLGYPIGEPGQYKLQQWMAEICYHHRGLSVQSEYHWKRIDDTINQQVSELWGYYAQAAYFFHEAFDKFPSPLELGIRIANVDSLEGNPVPADKEASFAANWFFSGHNNKLTADVTRLESTLPGGSEDTGTRVRFQWDITF